MKTRQIAPVFIFFMMFGFQSAQAQSKVQFWGHGSMLKNPQRLRS